MSRAPFHKHPNQLSTSTLPKILQIPKYRVTNELQRWLKKFVPYETSSHHFSENYFARYDNITCTVTVPKENESVLSSNKLRTSVRWLLPEDEEHLPSDWIGVILGNNYLLQKRHHLSSIYKQSCTQCWNYFMTFWTKLSNFRTGHSHLAWGSLDLATWIEGILVIIVQSWPGII